MKEAVFSLNETLRKGLAPNFNPRNRPMLIQALGAVPLEEALQSVQQFNPIDTSVLGTLPFPYPQLFVCSDCTIVCTPTAIYEYASPLTLKINNLPEGVTWTCIDYKNFIYLSNCSCAVIKLPSTGEYVLADDQYIPSRAGCDYLGQAVISPCPEYEPTPPTPPEENMPVPDVFIEMHNVTFWQPPTTLQSVDSVTPAEMNRTLNTNDFDGNPTYWWEVVGGNTYTSPLTEDYTLYLVDTNGNEYTSLTFEAETPDSTNWEIVQRKRVQFTPPAGETTFAVKLNPRIKVGSTFKSNPVLGAIRIIIKQDETATKSMIQVPMQCLGDWGLQDFFNSNNSFSKDFYTYKEGDVAHLATYDDVLTSETTNYRNMAGIWKYDSTELAFISKALFEAVGGSPPQLLAGTGSGTLVPWVESGSPTASWMIALFDSTETEVPGSRAEGSLGGSINFTAQLPLTSGTYHPKTSTDGGSTWNTLGITTWTVNHTPVDGTITWNAGGYSGGNPWAINPFGGPDGLLCRFSWQYSSGDSLDTLSIALFDATTDTMVPGTELVWGPNSDVSRKQVLFDPADLVSGHEYEMRWKIPNSGGVGAMIGFESNLYLWVDPIESLTIWQRVAMGEYNDYAGISAGDFNDEARVLLNLPSGASAFFENVAFYWGGETSRPLSYSLVDAGATDFGRAGTPVSGSELAWEGTEDLNVRQRKRSPALALTDGNRYLTLEANNEDVLFQVQAFLVVSVTK